MAMWIPIENASAKYKLTVRQITQLVNLNIIASFSEKDVLLIYKNDLLRYLNQQKHLLEKQMEWKKAVAEIEENMTNIIEKEDDVLFRLKTLKIMAPLFKMLITEMAMLIIHSDRRAIFHYISLGGEIADIAKTYNLTYDQACAQYEKALAEVSQRTGFIKKYREDNLKLRQDIQKCEDEKRVGIQKLERLEKIVSRILRHQDYRKMLTEEDIDYLIPDDAEYLLSLSFFQDFKLDNRLLNCLYSCKIETVEDLLKYTAKDGLDVFLQCRNFGKYSLKKLIKVLQERGILDENGKSELYKYVLAKNEKKSGEKRKSGVVFEKLNLTWGK